MSSISLPSDPHPKFSFVFALARTIPVVGQVAKFYSENALPSLDEAPKNEKPLILSSYYYYRIADLVQYVATTALATIIGIYKLASMGFVGFLVGLSVAQLVHTIQDLKILHSRIA